MIMRLLPLLWSILKLCRSGESAAYPHNVATHEAASRDRRQFLKLIDCDVCNMSRPCGPAACAKVSKCMIGLGAGNAQDGPGSSLTSAFAVATMKAGLASFYCTAAYNTEPAARARTLQWSSRTRVRTRKAASVASASNAR